MSWLTQGNIPIQNLVHYTVNPNTSPTERSSLQPPGNFTIMNSITAFCAAIFIVTCQVYGRPQENAAAATASAAPKAAGNITLLKNDVVPLDGKGSYSYDIELSDGTKLIQSGHTEAPAMGQTDSSIVIEGSYAYVAPDGKQISITYVADKNGFQPKGDAIPTQGPANAAAAAPAGNSSPAPPAPAPAAAASAPAEVAAQ